MAGAPAFAMDRQRPQAPR